MPYIFNKYYPARNLFFALGEGVLIFLALNAVFLLTEGWSVYTANLALFAYRGAMVTVIFQICLYYFDLYDQRQPATFKDTASRITLAFGVGCILMAVLYCYLPVIIISTKVFWLAYLAICVVVALWRGFYAVVLERHMFTRPVVILGAGKLAGEITAEINGRHDSGYHIAAHVLPAATQPLPGRQAPVIAQEELPRFCQKSQVEKIIFALADRRGKTPIKELMACKLQGTPIEDGITFYEGLTGKIMVEKVDPTWIIFSDGFKKSRFTLLMKRGTDLTLALAGFTLTLPLTMLTALLIKVSSPGPIFYLQERVGERGKPFQIVKFRSMRPDAEKDGPQWAAENDDRIGKLGRFIRKLRLDELPQLWNVLKGEMSLVGPRPERPFFVEQLDQNIPYYALRHAIKPGITGWAQIFYPYGATEEDALKKLEYDLYYLKNLNMWMDLWIIMQTMKIVLSGKGAR